MKALKHQKAYGYHRLETDAEIVARLRILGRDNIADLDAWMEKWGYGGRKMIYVP